MIAQLFIEQGLNGLQLGITLFLMAAGLTLVFGIMDVIHLSHGSFYMLGAYLTATLGARFDSYLLGLALAIPLVALIGMVVEWIAIRRLYERDHLDQVLATFGLIMFFNEAVRMIWGHSPSSCHRRHRWRALSSCCPACSIRNSVWPSSAPGWRWQPCLG